MAKSKQVAVREKPPAAARKGTAMVNPADFEKELLADSGQGFEEATRDAFAIPFIRILQDLSPQVKKKMPGYIEGAKPGQLLNTVSQKVYDEIRVIPCYYSQSFIEWLPRDKGGGLVAVHPPGTPLIQQTTREGSKNVLPNGHELADTRSHFVLVVNDDGSYDGALIAMASTALKISRRWMSQMRGAVIEVGDRLLTPPMFAWSYKLTTEEEANDQGSWYQWVVSDRERVSDATLYRAAKAFGTQMKGGNVKVNYEEGLQQAGNGGGGGRGPDSPDDLDNEIDA